MGKQANVGPATAEEKYHLRQLMKAMHDLSRETPASKRKVRQTKHTYDGHDVTSWKCNEFLYKKDPCPLPTLARGLFTSGYGVEETVVARGYNKFFNIGEVAKTKWPAIISDTRGPYELTVKENGCLILAAALDDGKKLLVTSKHAVNVPHAEVGMQWMNRHLALANKTPEEFAAFLHENNATAVYELCDDGFEEHILEYPERTRGLYLHGINRNASELDTWASSDVTKVAEEYGFHATQYFTFDTAEEGKEFADKVRKDHVLGGRAIEGFVVRCRTVKGDQPFMFKIKYDEPYLMFREWREVTNRIRAGSTYRTNYPLTKRYAAWVKEQIKTHPEDFEEYGKQKGIISARKRFLAYYQSHGGSEADVFEQAEGCKKTLIMPIATIGCGKTTLSLVLSKLFGFGHVQNDNIPPKNRRAIFHREILNQFDDHSFVIADRNNHLLELRTTLKEAICGELPGCRVVALYWSHDDATKADILSKNTKRIVSRGDAHQTLTPQGTKGFRNIMRDFVTKFAPLDQESDNGITVDDVIMLDPMAESSVNVRDAINGLCDMFPDELKRPTEAEIDNALEKAFEYKPTLRQNISKDQRKAKKQTVEFVGLVPRNVNIGKWLTQLIDDQTADTGWSTCTQMVKDGCLGKAFHITLAHKVATKDPSLKPIYDGYVQALGDGKGGNIVVQCHADYIVCNGDVMALRVKSMEVEEEDGMPDAVTADVQSGSEEMENRTMLLSTNPIPHITLCVGQNAKPVQSNAMLKAVFGAENAISPQIYPDGWTVIPTTLSFNAVVQKFMTRN